MGNRTETLLAAVAAIVLLTALSTVSMAGSVDTDGALTPEKLIAAHVQSIAATDLLSSIQTRAFLGKTDVRFLQGMTGSVEGGVASLISAGDKMSIILKYNALEYPQEYFSYDGDEVSVGYIAPGQRSPLADFLFRFNGIMKKGFLGGTLSMAWPLLDMQGDEVALKYQQSKVEGRDLHQLEWPISILGNVRIRMYFEPETYRHVRTEYDVRITDDVSGIGEGSYLGEMGSAAEDSTGWSSLMGKDIVPDSVYKLVEKFDNFKKVSGMVLPHKYALEYSRSGQESSYVANWTVTVRQFTFNKAYDDKIFKAQK